MAENLDICNAAVSLLIKAALLAARFSGRVRKRSLKRLAGIDADAKAKEIVLLKDRVYQLEMQLSILQKHFGKKGKSPRYTAHVSSPERVFAPSLVDSKRSGGRLTGTDGV